MFVTEPKQALEAARALIFYLGKAGRIMEQKHHTFLAAEKNNSKVKLYFL